MVDPKDLRLGGTSGMDRRYEIVSYGGPPVDGPLVPIMPEWYKPQTVPTTTAPELCVQPLAPCLVCNRLHRDTVCPFCIHDRMNGVENKLQQILAILFDMAKTTKKKKKRKPAQKKKKK